MLRAPPDPRDRFATVLHAHDASPTAGVPTRTGRPGTTIAARTRAYFLLTKPRVVELLLVTTVPAMVLAAGRMPSLLLVGAVLLGGALAAGGANTINCWIERDRDRLMRRTHHRPLPAGDIRPGRALAFGVGLEAVSFVFLWAMVNLLSATLAVSATLFYVFVYTIWLKPRSPQNIVIGGAAGAVPVLVGWASVTGRLAAPAWVLFAIVFCWTPPHFWALSLRYRDDYAAAGIPMLPVVKGIAVAARQIVVYACILLAVTLALVRVAETGAIYLVAAAGLGVALVWQALRLQREATPERALKLFRFSNQYLTLLFAAIAVDTLVRGI